MQLTQFIAFHSPALERDEVRHNLILGLLARAAKEENPQLVTWTLGGPGACAIKTPGRMIILGELTREECRRLAEDTRDLDYPGVVGIDLAPLWFVERAGELGISFAEPIPQHIQVLRETPAAPSVPGHPRQVVSEDGPLLADWLTAFSHEAVPHEPMPPREAFEKVAAEGRHLFWVSDERPVSVAGTARRMRTVAAIAPVYTPPEVRRRGFAGAVTATMAERLFAEGRQAVCLYTDRRNVASNRCYARIGFKPVHESWVYPRRMAQG